MVRAALAPSRVLLDSLRPIAKPTCPCSNALRTRSRGLPSLQRGVSTTASQLSEMEVDGKAYPRWSRTPPAMKAPVPIKFKPDDYKPFKTNSDPGVLDEMYRSLLGKHGDQLLSEETKWLAITHKSFDQGRRGFNERLAYLGKRIIELQISLGMLNATNPTKPQPNPNQATDPHGREPFHHPAIDNVEILSSNRRNRLTHNDKYARLARKHNLQNVVRWLPKNPDNLEASGSNMVYAQSICAIIGAIALERGGAIANEIARERILRPIGLTSEFDEQVEAPAAEV